MRQVVMPIMAQKKFDNLNPNSNGGDCPIIMDNVVGTLEYSFGVALVGANGMEACDKVLIHAVVVGECEVDRDIYQANLMMMNESSSGLDFSAESPIAIVDLVLSPSHVRPKGIATLVDVPINLISPNVLNA
ncbi:hypothetical protein MA16_Dca017293 [Dendrobium catenatum]|uniref:Uncharacterized protein n=1 Tax=Dendrobium catenatum TaxID=906689 RepID=A0A2I0XG36_9ASPA|nr:hypothetical protein MA16_Dca017293 [Dendrobium catenatum]